LDFRYKKKLEFKSQKILFENNTQITNKKIIFSNFLYQTNFQFNDLSIFIQPQFYLYPTVIFFKNNSRIELVYKRKIFLKSNYQNFTDLNTSYFGAGILTGYGNFGLFYSTLFLPSYLLEKNIKNIKIRFSIDALMNEKDTLGIFSEKRKNIYSIFPQRNYFLDFNLKFSNIAFNFLAIKILDGQNSYDELKKSPVFYDINFYIKNEGKNFRYSFKMGNYYNNFTSKNFYFSLFSLNKIGQVYFINELEYFTYRTLIYDLSIGFNEENSYLTFGVKNLFSKNDPVYSYFSSRTYFFLLSFSKIQFFD
jgi:hypothetical protein